MRQSNANRFQSKSIMRLSKEKAKEVVQALQALGIKSEVIDDDPEHQPEGCHHCMVRFKLETMTIRYSSMSNLFRLVKDHLIGIDGSDNWKFIVTIYQIHDMKKLSDQDQHFIVSNYLHYTNVELGEMLGVVKATIGSFLRRNRLYRPKEVINESKKAKLLKRHEGKEHPEDPFIKEHYLTVNVNQLSIQLNRSEIFIKGRLKKLGLVIPPEIIEQRKLIGRVKPGNVPKNKGKKQLEYMSEEAIERTKATRFKPGQRVHNEGHDGDIRIRTDHKRRNGGRQIKYIRLAKGKWKELHIFLYEQIHGPIPKKHILACKDGNTLNADPDNWFVLSKAENAKRNQNYEKRSETMKQLYQDDKIRNPFKDASDIAVSIWLFHGNTELQKEALKHPELLQLKRAQILHKRTINNERKNHQDGE